MTTSTSVRASITILLLTSGILAVAQTRTTPQVPTKILFIGNSLTYFQEGIYTHLQKMGEVDNPRLTIQADKAVVGGQYFKTLWERYPEPRRAIAKGYEVVVLQEDLPETRIADFREYARKFVAEIKRTGARPVLLMAWAYQRLGWISMAQIAEAHREAAKELAVDVAPVGLAWERAAKQRPELNLLVDDKEHPSIYGTYLATAVVYVTIYGRNPTNIGYLPRGVSAEAGSFLRKTAWETVQEYRKQNP
jgi:hypothetical protein